MGKLRNKFIKYIINGTPLASVVALAGSLYIRISTSTLKGSISPYTANRIISPYTSTSGPYGLSSSYIHIIVGDIIILLFIALAVGMLKKRGQ